eukprot:CAMPEP_0175144816 /NCGR_PEP_ID=MMETSP0087-20121206/14382_1 /TAXON_ID=136419 /ORGANISM="Unknown Unknown, Strain D1" /LENGTH=207 /DNA_ID=CAMNT_0016429407 /DNA_START=51 /DNA_END=671 /DNA_ORIENTATION=+
MLPKKVLVVCTGNTCRSAMAMQLIIKLVAETSFGMTVDSAGVRVDNKGSPSPSQAIEVMKSYGCDLSQHRSKPVTEELVDWADAIWVMTQPHLDMLQADFPMSKCKAERLNVNADIADPWSQSVEVYHTTCLQIEAAIRNRIAAAKAEMQDNKVQESEDQEVKQTQDQPQTNSESVAPIANANDSDASAITAASAASAAAAAASASA